MWQGKSRIKSTIFCKEYAEGGLKMPNINDYITALKTTWIRRISNQQYKFLTILNTEIETDNIFNWGETYIEQGLLKIKNVFWQDVLKGHLAVLKNINPVNTDEFLSSPLFYNKNIKTGNRIVFSRLWYNKGMCFVNDIVKSDGNFYSQNELNGIYNININFLQYYGLIKATTQWKETLKLESIEKKLDMPFIPYALKVYRKQQKGVKDMYKVLNSNVDIPAGKAKWNSIYNLSDEIWKKIYLWPHNITKNSTLKWFQFRINHNILATNKFLNKIKIVNNPLCTFCKTSPETIKHLFWDCEISKAILRELHEWLHTRNINLTIEERSFIFGICQSKTSIMEQQILLETKYYIYFCRCSKVIPNLITLKNRIQLLHETTRHIAIMENKYDSFCKTWEEFTN